jgi:hypothetical protein
VDNLAYRHADFQDDGNCGRHLRRLRAQLTCAASVAFSAACRNNT